MKLSQTLFAVANLAPVAVCFEPTAQDAEGNSLSGQEALNYLFKYDPERPHISDDAVITLPGGNPNNLTLGYDQGYLTRICSPREATGEQFAYMESQADVSAGPVSYEQVLADYRGRYSGSPFPCERLKWIHTECGIVDQGLLQRYDDRASELESNMTITEQNACLCGYDFWMAKNACGSCFYMHTGNKTYKVEDQERISDISQAMCTPASTASPTAYWDYFLSYPPSNPLPLSVISDAAPGETAPGKYWPGAGSDLLPATIQSPAFVRTVEGAEVTMTPGPFNAVTESATTASSGAIATISGAASTGGSATSSSATVTTGGAVAMKPVGGLMAGVLGAVLLL